MAAPTVVYLETTTASASTTLPSSSSISSPAVGDLCIITVDGTQNLTADSTAPIYSGSTDAGFTSCGAVVNSGSTEGKVRAYWKVLTSSDFSGSNLKQFVTAQNSGWTVLRQQIWIFRHANGWDGTSGFVSGDYYTDIAGFTANSAQSLTHSTTRPGVSVFVWANSSGQATLQVTWQGQTAREPYFGDSTAGTTTTGGHSNHYNTGNGAAQADYQEFDSGSQPTSFAINVGASSTHAVLVATFQTKNSTVSGSPTFSGGGTLSATGVRTTFQTATMSGGGTLSATGTVNRVRSATMSGGGVFSAQPKGAISGTGTFSGGGTFTATWAHLDTGSLSGGGSFAATGARTAVTTGTMQVTANFRATGITGAIPTGKSGTWESGALIRPTQSWSVTTPRFSSTATFSATGRKVTNTTAGAQVRGGGTFTATGTAIHIGVARFANEAIFAATRRPRGKSLALDAESRITLDREYILTLDASDETTFGSEARTVSVPVPPPPPPPTTDVYSDVYTETYP